jgi:hypothetical protein
MKARPSPPSASPTSSLEKETLAAFSAWRLSAPVGFRRMSESLWGAAVRLADNTSVYKAARLLRLDFSQLKKRVLAASEETSAGTLIGERNHPPARHSPSLQSPDLAISSVSSHGFMEVSDLGGIASGPQPLAEIRSPAGFTLRLFSIEVGRIIETFMQS